MYIINGTHVLPKTSDGVTWDAEFDNGLVVRGITDPSMVESRLVVAESYILSDTLLAPEDQIEKALENIRSSSNIPDCAILDTEYDPVVEGVRYRYSWYIVSLDA